MKKFEIFPMVVALLILASAPSFALLGLDINAKAKAPENTNAAIEGEIAAVNTASNTVVIKDPVTGTGREVRVPNTAGLTVGTHVRAQFDAGASAYNLIRT